MTRTEAYISFVWFLCSIPLVCPGLSLFFFFFNDTATTEIYTLSLHDALPISRGRTGRRARGRDRGRRRDQGQGQAAADERSEEHTSELQSRQYLVCRLLLEKKKQDPHPVDEEVEPVDADRLPLPDLLDYPVRI